MNARKHVAGFIVFSIVLSSAVLINYFLTIPDAILPAVPVPQPVIISVQEKSPLAYRVRQVSLDYIHRKSYTELSLELKSGQPAPETIRVTTTYFSPETTRAEDWTTITKISEPFERGNQTVVVATADWELPPTLYTEGAGYFARVEVSAEYQGVSYQVAARSGSDIVDAVPVVVHWPDKKEMAARAAKKFSR
jgi:hypothetical protein